MGRKKLTTDKELIEAVIELEENYGVSNKQIAECVEISHERVKDRMRQLKEEGKVEQAVTLDSGRPRWSGWKAVNKNKSTDIENPYVKQ